MGDTTVWLAIAIAAFYVILAIGAIWEATRRDPQDRPNHGKDEGFPHTDSTHFFRLPA